MIESHIGQRRASIGTPTREYDPNKTAGVSLFLKSTSHKTAFMSELTQQERVLLHYFFVIILE